MFFKFGCFWSRVQVLREYKKNAEKPGKSTAQQKAVSQEELEHFMKTMCASDVGPTKRETWDMIPNLIFMLALDKGLATINKGLREFMVDAPLRPLGQKERRYFLVAADLPSQCCIDGSLRRACVEDLDTKKTRLGFGRPS